MDLIKVTPSDHVITYNPNMACIKVMLLHGSQMTKEDKGDPEFERYWKPKKIKDLIGKYAIRCERFRYKTGYMDPSYTDEVKKIINQS